MKQVKFYSVIIKVQSELNLQEVNSEILNVLIGMRRKEAILSHNHVTAEIPN